MSDFLLVLFTLLAVLAALLYKYFTWNYDFWAKLGVPGPRPHFLFGNFPSAATSSHHVINDIEKVYYEYKNKQHAAVGTLMLRSPELLVLDPKLAVDVMVQNFGKFRDNLSSTLIGHPDVDKYAARNPFFCLGDAWKRTRTEAAGGVTPAKLNAAYPIWKEASKKLHTFVQSAINKGNTVLETKDLCYRFTLAIVGDFLLGIDLKTLQHAEISTRNDFREMCERWIDGILESAPVQMNFKPRAIARMFQQKRSFPQITDTYFARLLKEAMALRQRNPNAHERVDFLNYLLQLQEKKPSFTYDDSVGNMLTILLDSYETSGVVLAHCLFYLAKHPDVQQKLREEIVLNLDTDGFLTFDNLMSLPYLDQCVQETMRLISPLPLFARLCSEPTELDIGGGKHVKMQPGMVVRIPIFCYHHDPEYFPHPYTYQPERFDNGAHIELTKKGIFMPFGTGPRICLGMRMGLLEVKMGLVQILSRYRVKSCSRTIEEKRPDADTLIFGLAGEFWLAYEALES